MVARWSFPTILFLFLVACKPAAGENDPFGDDDRDGIPNWRDEGSPVQDSNRDGIPDHVADDDGDGIINAAEQPTLTLDSMREWAGRNVFGWAVDLDHDSRPAQEDNCPFWKNYDQADADGNHVGDACTDEEQYRRLCPSLIRQPGPWIAIRCDGHSSIVWLVFDIVRF